MPFFQPRPWIGEDSSPFLVRLHVDMNSIKCIRCEKIGDFKEIYLEIFEKGKGIDLDFCNCEDAIIIPNIVLYDADHTDGDEIGMKILKDVEAAPDLLIVIGNYIKKYNMNSRLLTLKKPPAHF